MTILGSNAVKQKKFPNRILRFVPMFCHDVGRNISVVQSFEELLVKHFSDDNILFECSSHNAKQKLINFLQIVKSDLYLLRAPYTNYLLVKIKNRRI